MSAQLSETDNYQSEFNRPFSKESLKKGLEMTVELYMIEDEKERIDVLAVMIEMITNPGKYPRSLPKIETMARQNNEKLKCRGK